jgi:hypothetical protein
MRKDLRAGGMAFSGRELFDFNPDWAVESDDDGGEAMGADEYLDRSEDDGEIPDGTMHAPKFENLDEELFGEEDLEGLSEDSESGDESGEQSDDESMEEVAEVAEGIKNL